MNFYERRHFSGCLFSHFPPVLQSADFILHFTLSLQSPFWILPLISLQSAFYPQSAFSPGPQSAVQSLQSASLFYTDRICICCEWFVFAVSDLYLMWTICNLLWWICIWCECFEFDVSILFWCDSCGPPKLTDKPVVKAVLYS